MADPYAIHRAKMREKCGYCGPYRLGLAVGRSDDDLPPPYSNPKSIHSYNTGIERGLLERKRFTALHQPTGAAADVAAPERN